MENENTPPSDDDAQVEPTPDWVWRVCHSIQFAALESGDVSPIEIANEMTGHGVLGGVPVLRFTRDQSLLGHFTTGREGGAVIRLNLAELPADAHSDTNVLGDKLPDIYILAEAVVDNYEIEQAL
jgi:hypothetical protein